jgi:hypothetical protein
MKFFKVSAKSRENLNEAYNTLVSNAFEYVCSRPKRRSVPIIINDRFRVKKDKRKCCD